MRETIIFRTPVRQYDKLAPTPATDPRIVDQIKFDIQRFDDLSFPRDLGGLVNFLKTKSTREKIGFLGSLVAERSFAFKYRLEIIYRELSRQIKDEIGGDSAFEVQVMLIRLTPKSTRFGGDMSVPWLTGCSPGFRRCILDVAMTRCTARHTSEPPPAR